MRRIALDPTQTGQVKYSEIHAALGRSKTLRSVRPGKHTVYVGPTGSVPVPNHDGDCPRGTWRSICRLAILAGLAVMVAVIVLAL